LLRVAATANGVRVDTAGQAPGRGAYLHRDAGCVARAKRSGALGRALRTSLGEDEVGRLMLEIERMGAV
jgi:predicted RNA-binding protein YlxR (DUF448 family)